MTIESDEVVKSVGRVFAVLDLFDQQRTALNATEVERRLGYPQSSTLALLKSMVRLGYFSFDRVERTYFPTMRVAMLGSWIETSLHGEVPLLDLMDEISSATGETVALSCHNDLNMQYLKLRPGTRALTLNLQPGDLAPLFESVVGLTALSERTDDEIRKFGERVNRQLKRGQPKLDVESALVKIRANRLRGYSVGQVTFMDHNIGVIAWLLPSSSGGRSIVLSVSGPAHSIAAEENDIIRTVTKGIKAHS